MGELESGIVIVIAIILVILVINLFIAFRRAKRAGRSRGRNYVPPDEAKQAAWRDKEIIRRIEREQDNMLERVKLKNETLALYEAVRQRHAKKGALERLGIEADDDKLDEMTSLGLEENRSDK